MSNNSCFYARWTACAVLLLNSTLSAMADGAGFLTHQIDKAKDPKAMSANDFGKILDNSLGDKFKDLIVVFGACYSDDFTKVMEKSKAAKSGKNFASLSSTGPKCPVGWAGGTMDQGNSFLQGIASGFSSAFSGTPGTVGHAFETGQKQVERDNLKAQTQKSDPTLFPNTDQAKNITFGQNATSYHAILFSGGPKTCADWYDLVKMYESLITANYKAEDIKVFFGSGERDGNDGTPKLDDGKSALDHKKNQPNEHFCTYRGPEDELDADGKQKLIKFKAATYKNFEDALKEFGPISEKSATEQYFVWTGSHNTAAAKDLIALAPGNPGQAGQKGAKQNAARKTQAKTSEPVSNGPPVGISIGIGIGGGGRYERDHESRRRDDSIRRDAPVGGFGIRF